MTNIQDEQAEIDARQAWLDGRFADAAMGDAARVVQHLYAGWVERAEDALAQWDEARDASPPDDEAAYDLLIAHQSLTRLRDQADLVTLRDALAQRITRDATALRAALRLPQPDLWLEEAAALCDSSSDDPIDWDDALIDAAWRSWQDLDVALLAADALHLLDGVDPDALDALEDALAECVAFAQEHAWAWMPAEGPIRASASAISPPGAESAQGFAWTQLYLNQLDAIDAWEAMQGLVQLGLHEALSRDTRPDAPPRRAPSSARAGISRLSLPKPRAAMSASSALDSDLITWRAESGWFIDLELPQAAADDHILEVFVYDLPRNGTLILLGLPMMVIAWPRHVYTLTVGDLRRHEGEILDAEDEVIFIDDDGLTERAYREA